LGGDVTGPIIRRLQVDEIPAMQVLRREALTDDPLAFGATVEDDSALDTSYAERSLADPSSAAIFAAFVARAPVGMVGLVRMTREKIKHRALVWGMFVQAGYRGRGVGTELLGAAVAHARSWNGVRQVHLSVTSSAPGARRLYERAGFVVWGCEPHALAWNGTVVDEYHLVLALAPRDAV
jgi:RimJ/RimL family protein N-acetyltransferase